ncbi:hypothetical protein I316_02268 [Kwoniella heveanensis BCC8398]|uniref:BZIP domain-containing protein n=1 Tax=Kwoniella heveanensis BCC8398 TaxID=1296120 RepID=A0A1B9GXN4_9TREE|nr:hypothetical protein I316_02268 [Kwoniella heveanensis BCC8398]
MEQSWPSGGLYNYYTPEALRSADRQTTSPSTTIHSYDEPSHRRSNTLPHSSTFLPPPPPVSHGNHNNGNSGSMNLPPFSQTFYSPYPSSSNNHGASQSTPSNVHTLPHNVGYSPHISMSAPSSNNYPYPLTSPLGLADSVGSGGHRAPPPHSYNESPRIPGYSSSPGLHHFSPTSPTNNLIHGMNPSSASTSSSSFPSLARTPANLPKGLKRRSTSASHSNGSWDDGDRYMPTSTEMDVKELADEQPWGMPQEQYKALNPRDKKQVRNRIGARRFRAKRKDYVSNLEANLRSREDDISALQTQVEQQRNEINELRQRLGLPRIPDPDPVGLGLVVGANGNGGGPASTDGWGQSKLEPSA